MQMDSHDKKSFQKRILALTFEKLLLCQLDVTVLQQFPFFDKLTSERDLLMSLSAVLNLVEAR